MAIYTPEDVRRARQEVVRKKWAATMNKQSEAQRVALARRQAQKLGDAKGDWQHVGTIPIQDYMAIYQTRGNDFFSDEESLKWLNRRVLHPNGMARNRI